MPWQRWLNQLASQATGHTGFKQHIEVRQSLGATASCLQILGGVGGAAEQRQAMHARIKAAIHSNSFTHCLFIMAEIPGFTYGLFACLIQWARNPVGSNRFFYDFVGRIRSAYLPLCEGKIQFRGGAGFFG